MDSLIEQLSESVSSARTLEDLTRPMLEMLETVTGLESTYLTTIDIEQGLQRILFARNAKEMQIPEGISVPWTDTLCRRAIEEERLYTNDVPAVWGDSEAARALGIQTYVSTPVRTGDGELYGTLCAASAEQLPLPPNASAVLHLFARLIGQQVERELMFQKLAKAHGELATHAATDALTGLPNRRTLLDELRRMMSQGALDGNHVLVGFIDLDHFKAINDEHGHETGDEFLRGIATQISAALRTTDRLARFGGDEFVAIGPGPKFTGDPGFVAASALAERLTAATVRRLTLSRVTIAYRGASVGVVAVDPRITSAEEALRRADDAMYDVKRARRMADREPFPDAFPGPDPDA